MKKFKMIQLINKVETRIEETVLSKKIKTEIAQMLLDVKNEAINYKRCCMGEAEQLVCDNKCEWTRYPKNGIWYDGCVKCGKEVAD